MAIISSPTRKDAYYSWDCFVFFELRSECKQHPSLIEARPLLVQTASGLKQHFILKNAKNFPICYKILSTSNSLNVWPSMGMIDPETEVCHFLF